ncbi:MAG: riboflavin synthase [Candidatus Gracilibacteria bacterium]|nr:riboflavin synthase [bacterium]MDZ4216861.1 riboflavin synthase [Candidatus Gracilibacteria bacterium]
MFTGIIETTAALRSITDNVFWFNVPFASELKIGQSVACNGACLTVVEIDEQGFRVDVLEETMRLTNLGDLRLGDLLNVERAMKTDDRLDGHIVLGHVEGFGVIKKIDQESGSDLIIAICIPLDFMKYVILKGIIILDGIALTVIALDDEKAEIQVAIIPHTWQNTNLHARSEGDKVNVETDLLAHYVERLKIWR